MKISTVLDFIDSGDMALPEFQRGNVWNRDQVRGLFDSLYRRHPAGGLLVWVTEAKTAYRRGDGPIAVGSVKLLLDGQQRMTSLYGLVRGEAPRFFDGNPQTFTGLRFHLEDETFAFYQPIKMRDDPLWDDVTALMVSGQAEHEALITSLAEHLHIGTRAVKYSARIARLLSIRDIDLHVEEVTGAEKSFDVVVDTHSMSMWMRICCPRSSRGLVRGRDQANSSRRLIVLVTNFRTYLRFNRFKPLFEQVENELDTGLRTTRPFKRKATVASGRFLIVGGQNAYVVEMDDAGRRITESSAGLLFADHTADGDDASSTIYVLRSKSDLPIAREHRNVLHKISVTSGKVDRRTANAKIDATFLLADVEVVATYKLCNIDRTKLEKLIYRIIDPAGFDIEIKDRFGNPVVPREWFCVPFAVLEEAIQRIIDGSIKSYMYDPQQVRLVEGKAG